MFPGLVRIPDIAFFSNAQFPGGQQPGDPITPIAPKLAIEVFSAGNTKQEMERKLREYFLAGVEVVWFVYPKRRMVEVFTAPDKSLKLSEEETLDGGDVLPGFRLPLKQLFKNYPPSASRRPRRKK